MSIAKGYDDGESILRMHRIPYNVSRCLKWGDLYEENRQDFNDSRNDMYFNSYQWTQLYTA